MKAKRKDRRPKPRRWWALVRGPRTLPVLFATREQARENRDPDEYIERVWVIAARPK